MEGRRPGVHERHVVEEQRARGAEVELEPRVLRVAFGLEMHLMLLPLRPRLKALHEAAVVPGLAVVESDRGGRAQLLASAPEREPIPLALLNLDHPVLREDDPALVEGGARELRRVLPLDALRHAERARVPMLRQGPAFGVVDAGLLEVAIAKQVWPPLGGKGSRGKCEGEHDARAGVHDGILPGSACGPAPLSRPGLRAQAHQFGVPPLGGSCDRANRPRGGTPNRIGT